MQNQKGSDSDGQLEKRKQISEKGKCVEDTVDAIIIDAHKLVMDSCIHTKSLQNSCNTARYSSTSSRSVEKEPSDNVNEESMKTICNANVEHFMTVSKDASLSGIDVQVVFETSSISADGNLNAIFNECKGHPSPIGDVIKDSSSLNENCVKLLKSSENEKSSFSFGTADKPTEVATAINNQSEKVCNSLDSNNNNSNSNGNGGSSSRSSKNNNNSIHGNGVTNGFENEVESRLVNLLQNSVLSLDAVTKQKTGTNSLEPERNIISLKKRKLLVLDINGLLADIIPDIRHVHRGRKKVGGKVVFKRPFCDDFMKFCFEKFDVGIWSSRKKYNVDDVIDYILGENRQKLLFCWDQDHCTNTGFRTLDNVHKPLVLKELKRLWNKEENDLPWEKGDFSPSNTLLVDDSPYKALCNPAFTAIFPDPYRSDNVNDTALGSGGDLLVYLEGLYEANDVQLYVKQHPFGQQSITSNDPFWNFYSQVIREVRHQQSFVSDSIQLSGLRGS